MNTVHSRRKYGREFKLGAVRLVTQGGRPVVEVARDRGVHENLLYKLAAKIYLNDTAHAFPGKGHLKPADEVCLHRRIRLRVQGEEDVPDTVCFKEQILRMEKACQKLSAARK